jgi:hypothetical protein
MDKRELIYIPIIHTAKDMGGLSDSIRQAALKVLGKQSLRQKDQLVDQIWIAIEQAIDSLELPFEKVRLYQDGLPICGREMEIVTDLANNGSRNHRLLEQLIRKGAVLMGTESAELLLEEYRLIKQTVSSRHGGKGADTPRDLQKKADILLKKRDQFIAQRINNTLGPGETGIIFLGMLHDLEGLVDKKIKIVYSITKPLSHRGINE